MELWLCGLPNWLGHTFVDQEASVPLASRGLLPWLQSPVRCMWPVYQLPGLNIRYQGPATAEVGLEPLHVAWKTTSLLRLNLALRHPQS